MLHRWVSHGPIGKWNIAPNARNLMGRSGFNYSDIPVIRMLDSSLLSNARWTSPIRVWHTCPVVSIRY
ncbi:hypothetical protein HNP02_002958 [Mycobacterium sp. AZCC_0083]|nr:hypothetical protein [Mycobacterium sp. AZCC_0083]